MSESGVGQKTRLARFLTATPLVDSAARLADHPGNGRDSGAAHRRRLGPALTWGVALGVALLAAAAPAEPVASPLTVEARAFTAGPYGEAWTLRVSAAGDEAALEIGFMLDPMGEMKGSFFVDRSRLAPLRRAIDTERFMELPHQMEPSSAPFHQPTLILDIALGAETHRVSLYDPDQLQNDAEVQRFLAVWDAAFALVPLKPSW